MTWRIRFHPRVADDLDAIARWILDYAGPGAAERKLSEIERAIASLADLPHRGSRRDDIVPGVRAIPAGRRAVIAFTLDEEQREVRIVAVVFGGGNWARVVGEREG